MFQDLQWGRAPGGEVAQDLWLAVVEGSAWSGLDGQVKVGLKGGS